MLTEYLLSLYTINIFEFLIQIILFYNLIQIIKQNNFYYLLSYFLLFIFYLGIYLILFDMDIACIILWILYGGVLIIFFVFSLMWFENIKNFKYTSRYKNIYYLISFLIIILNSVIFYDNNILLNNNWTIEYFDFYSFLSIDIYEELDNLGWGIIYYSTFFFLVLSYMLFLACCVSVAIIINSKKIKYIYINLYYTFIYKNKKFFPFTFFKYQNFFTQDYENVNKNYSFFKNYKIKQTFHKVKNFNRRI